MQRTILSVLCGFVLFTAQADPVIIQPRFTSLFRFSATDAWNIDLQFQAQKSLNAVLVAEISQSGKAVATLKSGTILLQPGVQSFTAVSISTSQLLYKSQAIADIESVTGSFPAGAYKICYFAQCVTADCDGLGANALFSETPQCFDLLVEPPTPLLLAFPEDKAELEWPRPTFNWIPPMPLSSISGFNYLFTLAEKQKGQSCNDAIVRNRPLYRQSAIDIPTLPYPAELNDLDTGKTYCWKVDGLVADIPVAQSEVWEFKLKQEKKEKYRRMMFLPEAEVQLKSYSIGLNDTAVFALKEEYVHNDESRIMISVYNETDHSEKNKLSQFEMTIHPGTNCLVLPLADYSVLKAGNTYVFDVVNGKREHVFVRLIITKEQKR